MLAPPRYSCRSDRLSQCCAPMVLGLHHTCPTDADIGWFDLQMCSVRLAHIPCRSSADTPSPGLFRIVEQERCRVGCPVDHGIEVLSSSWRRLKRSLFRAEDPTGSLTAQNCQEGERAGFSATLSTIYKSLANQKQLHHGVSFCFGASSRSRVCQPYKRGSLIHGTLCGVPCPPRNS